MAESRSEGRQLFCRLVTPAETVFDGEVDLVVVRIADGDLGVLVDHAPTVSMVEPGEVSIRQGEERRVFATSDGFFEVSENLVLVLVEEAVRPEEIDVSEAEDRIEEIEREIEGLTGDEDEVRERRRDLERRQRNAESLVRLARKYSRSQAGA